MQKAAVVSAIRTCAILLALAAVLAAGCNGSDSAAKAAQKRLAEGCTLNTDCNAPLVCVFSRCHDQCTSTRDCSAPARCVAADKPFRVCELPEDRRECSFTSDCVVPHVCAVDGVCRAECRDGRDCATNQVCSYGTCADPDELSDGRLVVKKPSQADGKLCTLHSDCANGLRCVLGRCHVECAVNLDCPAGQTCSNGLCSPAGGGSQDAGTGQTCKRSSDCAGNLACVAGVCDVECVLDKDCAAGQACVAQRCVLTGGGGGGGGGDGGGGGTDGGAIDGTTADSGGGGSTCSNGVKDGTETDRDCGGATCSPCGAGSVCGQGSDCSSGVCASASCQAPTCTDNVRNGNEGDVDCGGACPNRCDIGRTCIAYTDCQTSLCAGGRCRAAGCYDDVKNGSESDKDCGGPNCPPCAPNRACVVAGDCGSSVCTNQVCVLPACGDNVKNGNETDVDCGGGFCGGCADLKACNVGSDCTSNNCLGGRCQASTCADGVFNALETDRDCGGGSCRACSTGARCVTGNDCLSGICEGGLCQAPRCNDGRRGGSETDVDCGGTVCNGCAPGKACQYDRDCASQRCFNGACLATNLVNVQKQGTAPGRVTATNLDCGKTCSAAYPAGTQVTLTATPAPGATFTGWSGGGCSGTSPCSLTVTQATTVTATFDAALEDYTPLFVKSFSNTNLAVGDIDSSGDAVISGWATRGQVFDLGFGPLTVSGPQSNATYLSRYRIDSGAPIYGRFWDSLYDFRDIHDLAPSYDGFVWVASGPFAWLARHDNANGDVRGVRSFSTSPGYWVETRLYPFFDPIADIFAVLHVGYGCGTECSDPQFAWFGRYRASDLAPAWERRDVCDWSYFRNAAVTPANNIIGLADSNSGFGGTYSCNFGTGNITVSASSALVWSWDAAGALRWTRAIGGSGGRTQVRGVVADTAGDVYVTGFFTGQITVNASTTLTSAGGNDAFLAKLSGTNGQILWVERFGTTADGESFGQIARLPNDELAVLGYYPASSAINFDGVSLPSRPSGTNWFLAKFNATGQLLSIRQPGNGTVQGPSRLRVSANFRKLVLSGRTANNVAADWGAGVTLPAAATGLSYATFFRVN